MAASGVNIEMHRIRHVENSVNYLFFPSVTLRGGRGPFRTRQLLHVVLGVGEQQLRTRLYLDCRAASATDRIRVQSVRLEDAAHFYRKQEEQLEQQRTNG